MIAEGIQKIVDLTRGAIGPNKLCESDAEVFYSIGGNIERLALEPKPRKHTVRSLADLMRYANATVEADESATDDLVVWYGPTEVVLVLDNTEYRCSAVRFPLERSDVFNRVLDLNAKRTWFEQKEFVRLLKIDLAGTLEPVHLLDRVRKVRFDNGTVATGTVTRHQESLGREITSRAETNGEPPDEVTLTVSVYKTHGERLPLPLRCSVEVDPARGAFRLMPLPDELELILSRTLEAMAKRLGEGLNEGIVWFHGSP